MSSATDPAQPKDGSAGVKADRHASFQRASDEIESLEPGIETGRAGDRANRVGARGRRAQLRPE
jgi:hypothetical protein